MKQTKKQYMNALMLQELTDPEFYWMPSNEERVNYLDHPETSFIAIGQYQSRVEHRTRLKDEKNEDSKL